MLVYKVVACVGGGGQGIDGWDTDGIRMTYGHMEMNLMFHYTDGIRKEYGYGWNTDTWKRSLKLHSRLK